MLTPKKDSYLKFLTGFPKWLQNSQDENYLNFMNKLAEVKSKEWGISKEQALQEMLRDETYNYRQMYEDSPNPDEYLRQGHFPDTYKTPLHPTFSKESIYDPNNLRYSSKSAKIPYKIIEGGTWDNETRIFHLGKGQNRKNSQRYLDSADPGWVAIDNSDMNIQPDREQKQILDIIYNTAINNGLTRSQALGMMGNAWVESISSKTTKQIGGSAEGYFQMDDVERSKYLKWLQKNNRRNNAESETIYIIEQFKNRTPKTAFDLALSKPGNDPSKIIGNKTYRTANHPFHLKQPSEQAYKDWNSDNIDRTTIAFTRLYERSGEPAINRRVGAARYFATLYPEQESVHNEIQGEKSMKIPQITQLPISKFKPSFNPLPTHKVEPLRFPYSVESYSNRPLDAIMNFWNVKNLNTKHNWNEKYSN